ncbi:hypothetical protein BH10BAC3_BH10BAC3_22780 [soil metagenome]
MYGDLAPEVQHEIFKATQDLKTTDHGIVVCGI